MTEYFTKLITLLFVLGSSSAAAAETRGRSRTVSTLSDAATRDRSDSDGPGLFVVNDATQSAAQASSVRTAAAVSASSDSASLRIEAVASKPKVIIFFHLYDMTEYFTDVMLFISLYTMKKRPHFQSPHSGGVSSMRLRHRSASIGSSPPPHQRARH